MGILRHADVVPHDDDLDFDVHEEDFPKLFYLIDEFLDLGYQIQFLPNILKVGRITADPTKNVVADFFPYRINGARVEYADPNHRKWWPDWYYDNEDCFPTTKKKFGPLYINCPNDPKKLLDRYYPNWQDIIVIDTKNSHKVDGNV